MYIDMDNTIVPFDKVAWEKHQYPSIRRHKPWVSFLPADAVILSQYRDENERKLKKKWLDHYFPNIGRILTPISKSKTVSPCHHFLLDDYNKNLLEWKKAGGYPIKYDNGTNSKKKGVLFVHWEEDEEGISLVDSTNVQIYFYRKEIN